MNSPLTKEMIMSKIRSSCPGLGNFDPKQELYKLWYNESTRMVIYYDGWNRFISDDVEPCTENIELSVKNTLLEEYGL